MTELGVDGITVSPGYAYERAPDQQHFLNRAEDQAAVPRHLPARRGGKAWSFNQSGLFLDFLAGNQTYHCTPWGNPTRNVFGWQRPCYLLGEGYAKTFKELMEDTDWDSYGTGNYEKCADCMVHCGFEATAVRMRSSALEGAGGRAARRQDRGPMAPEIPLDQSAPGRIRVLPSRRRKARRDQRKPRPEPRRRGSG